MAARKTVCHSYTAFLKALDGRRITIDGVNGFMRVVQWRDADGTRKCSIVHKPSRQGKQSVAYRRLQKITHEDWDTDFTHEDHLPRLILVGKRLGIHFTGDR